MSRTPSLGGLTLGQQLASPWAAPFGLAAQPGGELRPRSPHFQALASLEEVKGGIRLRVLKEALDHPTTGPELARLRWEFLSSNLGEAHLSEWLAGAGNDPLKVGERRVELSTDQETVSYIVSKSRAKFWPFSKTSL